MATATHKPMGSSSERASNEGSREGNSQCPEGIAFTDSEDEYQSDENNLFDSKFQPRDTPDTAVSSRNTSSSPRKKWPSELKTIACTVAGCTKIFNRQSRLETHLRSHKNERPFVCKEPGCDKSYFDNKHLGQHIKGSHNNERSYKCNWERCDKSFLTATRLKRHIAGHEKKIEFKCTYPQCTKTFRKHNTLERHIRSDHMELVAYPCTYIDPMTGVACTAGFDGATGLSKHEERVHGLEKFFCPDCVFANLNPDGSTMHLGFVTDSQLQAHIKKEHNNCPFCEKKCCNHSELQKHIESQHSGTTLDERKKIPCTYEGCEKRFTKIYNRNVHIQTQHEGSRFICGTYDIKTVSNVPFDPAEGCGKGFMSKANLEDHIRTGHLDLPSLVNANRKRSAPNFNEDEDAESEFKDNEQSKPARQAKGKRAKNSAIDELTGRSYKTDPRRNISCLINTCPHRSMRDYDMKQHLRSKHGLSELEIEELEREVAFDEPEFQFHVGDVRNDDAYGEEAGGEEDADWDEERNADMESLEDLPYRMAGEDSSEMDFEWDVIGEATRAAMASQGLDMGVSDDYLQ